MVPPLVPRSVALSTPPGPEGSNGSSCHGCRDQAGGGASHHFLPLAKQTNCSASELRNGMTYQVLARKWRPQKFDDVVGQAHVLQPLTFQLSSGHLHSAILFTGTRGVGKTTLARLFAKSLNCDTNGVSANPCNTCSSCTDIQEGRFPDLIEVDAASRTRVEDTLELLENANYLPSRGRYKIYLIDEVHMLSTSSFNALLKTLEEPPPHVKFILATTDPQKLPITVLSRCLQFSLRIIPQQMIAERMQSILTQEEIAFDERALDRIAQAARGSMRDALTLLDQGIAFGQGQVELATVTEMLGTVSHNLLAEMFLALINQDVDLLFSKLALAESRSLNFDTVLVDMLEVVQSTAVLQFERSPVSPILIQLGKECVTALRNVSSEDLQIWYQIILQARKDQPYAPTPFLGFQMTWVRLLAFKPTIIERAALDWDNATKAQTIAMQQRIDTSSAGDAGSQKKATVAEAQATEESADNRVNSSIEQAPESQERSQLVITATDSPAVGSADIELNKLSDDEQVPRDQAHGETAENATEQSPPWEVTDSADDAEAGTAVLENRVDMPAVAESVSDVINNNITSVETSNFAPSNDEQLQTAGEPVHITQAESISEEIGVKRQPPEGFGITETTTEKKTQIAPTSTAEANVPKKPKPKIRWTGVGSVDVSDLEMEIPASVQTLTNDHHSGANKIFSEADIEVGFDEPSQAQAVSTALQSTERNHSEVVAVIDDNDFSPPSSLLSASISESSQRSDDSDEMRSEQGQSIEISEPIIDTAPAPMQSFADIAANENIDQQQVTANSAATVATQTTAAQPQTTMHNSTGVDSVSMELSKENWAAISAGLPVPGFAQSLAANCAFFDYDALKKKLSLILSAEVDTLHTDMAEKAILRALGLLYGADIQLEITVATAEERAKKALQTPAEIVQKKQQQHQESALDGLRKDPNIQQIESEFGVTLDPNQVKILPKADD